MKRLIMLLLAGMLVFSGCGKQLPSPETEATSEHSTEVESTTEIESSTEVEEILYEKFTIPEDWLDYLSEESLAALFMDYEYIRIHNEDGSWSYTMRADQHHALMEDIRGDIASIIPSYVETEDYPNIREIRYDFDMTNFEIDMSTEYVETFEEEFVGVSLIYWGTFYNIFSGQPPQTIVVKYFNPSGVEVMSYDSTNAFSLFLDESETEE